ncbi:hypothetical protein ADEAN_000222700 [Angomonas deanei]|uniref:Uncharacterized protein n=1 Tax=Angomonas deanei TaxID=59799 RepID=A0A7G2C4Y5_9TRYP|nr:hypothetical protein ADEAN_000222700 [Angomonas deanei]
MKRNSAAEQDIESKIKALRSDIREQRKLRLSTVPRERPKNTQLVVPVSRSDPERREYDLSDMNAYKRDLNETTNYGNPSRVKQRGIHSSSNRSGMQNTLPINSPTRMIQDGNNTSVGASPPPTTGQLGNNVYARRHLTIGDRRTSPIRTTPLFRRADPSPRSGLGSPGQRFNGTMNRPYTPVARLDASSRFTVHHERQSPNTNRMAEQMDSMFSRV